MTRQLGQQATTETWWKLCRMFLLTPSVHKLAEITPPDWSPKTCLFLFIEFVLISWHSNIKLWGHFDLHHIYLMYIYMCTYDTVVFRLSGNCTMDIWTYGPMDDEADCMSVSQHEVSIRWMSSRSLVWWPNELMLHFSGPRWWRGRWGRSKGWDETAWSWTGWIFFFEKTCNHLGQEIARIL